MRHRRQHSPTLIALRALLTAVTVVVLIAGAAFTSANVVPVSDAGNPVEPIDPGALAPAECSALDLTDAISGTGIIVGTVANDWIVGSDVDDTISGLEGDDCIEGRDGADTIEGLLGNDVCIGGGGNDTFVGCETEIQ